MLVWVVSGGSNKKRKSCSPITGELQQYHARNRRSRSWKPGNAHYRSERSLDARRRHRSEVRFPRWLAAKALK